MEEKLAVFPGTNGTYIIVLKDRIMTGFVGFNDARMHALAILSGMESFKGDHNLGDVAVDRTGMRAVLARTDDRIEETRFITEKDGSITIEKEEHPIQKAS